MNKASYVNSFARGYSRVLDLFGTDCSFPDISNPQQRDYNSLKGDWNNVGFSIKEATNAFASEHNILAE